MPTLITSSGGTLANNFRGNEPSIAVNPLNAANVVVAHGGGGVANSLAISLDGGATFPTEVAEAAPPAGFGACGDNTIAFDGTGHLYWSYLDCGPANAVEVNVQQVNPTTGALVGAVSNVSASATQPDDKEWIAVDANPASPFAGNVYIVWVRLNNPVVIEFSRSTTAAGTGAINGFSAPQVISTENNFVWPTHAAVAPNGDVYVAYHENTCGSNTTADQNIQFLRSTDGGVTFPAANKSSFNAGVTCNVQASPAAANQVPFVRSWMQGADAPYILPDPVRPGNVYVAYNSDPDGDFTMGDPGDVFLARSTNNGLTWSSFVNVSHGPANTLQAFPNASIDRFGNIAVFWYDTRGNTIINPDGVLNDMGQPGGVSDDHYAMNLFANTSSDGGVTFLANDFQVNDANDLFDPDAGASVRFGPNRVPPDGTADTLRIGEYNGIAVANGIAYVDWTGNRPDPPRATPPATNATGQQIFYRNFVVPNAVLPPGVNLAGNALTVCGDLDYPNEDDTFRIVRDPVNNQVVDIFINNTGTTPNFAVPLALIGQINVFAAGGNDDLIVDSSNGLISLSAGIRYDGDHPCPGDTTAGIGGLDRLDLVQSGASAPTINTDQLAPGATPGEGRSLIVDSTANTQRVDFQYLEPVVDTVASPTFNIASVPGLASLLDANNAINYSSGQLVAGGGRVTVDNFEPIEFSNKATLTINAGAGSDEINLNNPNPATGLTGDCDGVAANGTQPICVIGGDPTASDVLIANGTTAVDTITFAPTGADLGTISGAGPVAINFATIEHVTINGQGGTTAMTADTLTYQSPAGGSLLNFTPGATVNSGSITGRKFSGNGGTVLVPVDYVNLDHSRQLAQLIFANAGGHVDHLSLDGTNGSDVFTVNLAGAKVPAANGSVLVERAVLADALTHLIDTRGIDKLYLNGLQGDDQFNVGAALPYTSLLIDGGDPSASDTVSLSGATGAVNVTLADPANLNDTTVSGYGAMALVALTGVEKVNLAGTGAAATLGITGTAASDLIDLTPTAVGAGSFTGSTTGAVISSYAAFAYTGFTGNLSVTGGGAFDQLSLNATAGNDIINAVQTTATHLDFTLNAFTQGFTLTAIQAANINALTGDDLIRVSVADALEAAPAGSLRFTVDGGPPNASDRLIVNDDGIGDLTLLRQAPDQRSGSATVGALAPVVYSNIERLDITPITDPVNGGTGTDSNGRIKVFHTDPFEYNDTRLNSAQLQRVGESPTSPTIDPGAITTPSFAVPGDEDWYEFRPQATGTFQVKILFDTLPTLANTRPGLPGAGDLQLDIYDANGVLITSGVPAPGGKAAIFAATNNPVAPQFNRIFVRVRGATPDSINLYDFDNIAGLITGNPGVTNVDNEGPQVTDVTIDHIPSTTYNLFGVKPGNAAQGPTPRTDSLVIYFKDLPDRAPGFLYPAIDTFLTDDQARGLFQLTGDAVGNVVIDHVVIHNDPVMLGQTPTATAELFFREPLADDRFTLIVDDSLRDPAQNRLDGESNADEPNGAPTWPSGDGHSGGDFVARFTIDSRAEIGNYSAGSAFLDINGNYVIDPTGIAADFANRDLIFQFGTISDALFAGKFAPANAATNDGFDRLGAYGYDNAAKQYRFLLDYDNNGVADQRIVSAFQINAFPVAGNFDNDINHKGDEIGLFDGSSWYLDTNGDNQLDTRLNTNGTMPGRPIVGDFNGDGKDDLATYDAGTNTFYFDTNRNGLADDQFTIGGPINGFTEMPVAGDLNLDGIDDLGLWVPNRQGSPTPNISEWYFLVSDHTGRLILPHDVFDDYSPVPLGNDIFAQFGDNFALPIIGNFDPPAGPGASPASQTNALNKYDVNNDGVVTALDALIVINQINTGAQPFRSASLTLTPPFMDVNGNNVVTAGDALEVINYVNAHPPGHGEGEGESFDAALAGSDYSGGSVDDSLISLLAADTPAGKRRS